MFLDCPAPNLSFAVLDQRLRFTGYFCGKYARQQIDQIADEKI
jgi:hypothetical protein